MNKVERMKALFAGERVDRTPVGLWHHNDGLTTADEIVEAHLKLYETLDADIIKIMDDSFGHMLTEGICIEKPSDWKSIQLPGRNCTQFQRMLDVLRGLREKTHGEAMIFPTMWSPFKLASFTYVFAGSTDAMFMQHLRQDPESVLIGVDKIAETLMDWAAGYLEAGADGLYYSGQFSEPERFSDTEWERFVMPSDLKVLNVTKKYPDKVNIIHICGEVEYGYHSTPKRYVKYPGAMFNWDVHRSDLSLEDGSNFFDGVILGGLDNHGLLLNGTPKEIGAETERLIRQMGPKNYMVGCDCTIPANIEVAKLKAISAAAKKVAW